MNPRVCEYWLTCLALIAISLIANLAYFECGHVWDDLQHLRRIGEIETGRDSWWRFFTGYHNEHQLFLWKVWYAGTWRFFGVSPVAWHVMIALSQALGALGLYGTLRNIGLSLTSSLAAGCMWAGATIGGFDSPLIWIAASPLTFGVSWMLLAGWLASHATDNEGVLPRLGCATLVAASVATMSAMATLIPIVISGLWASKLSKKPAAWISWLTPVLIPVVVVLLMQFYMSINGFLKPPTGGGGEVSLAALGKVLAVSGNGMTKTLSGIAFQNTTLAAIFGVISMAVLIGLIPDARRVALWILPPITVYLVIVATARSDFPVEKFANMGRFQYLPIFASCSIVGVALGNGLELLKGHRARFATACIALIGIYMACQVNQARRSVTLAGEVNAPSEVPWKANIGLMRILAEGNSTTLPDIPVPSRSFHQSLSGMVAYATDHGQIPLKVRPWTEVSLTEIDGAIQMLRQLSTETSGDWAETLALGQAFREFFLLLADSGSGMQLPNIQVPLPKTKPMLLSQIQHLVAPDVKETLRIVDQMTAKDIEVTCARLSSVDHPIAKEFLGMLLKKSR